jgi:F0F1-type ATP synthase delta subunit
MLIVGFIIAQIVILAAIIIFLRRMIFSDTNSAINRLTRLDNVNREREKLLQQKLEQAERHIEEQKLKMQQHEQKVKHEAQRAANQLYEDIIKRAKDEGEEIVKKAHAAKEKMRVEAKIQAESQVIDICREVLNDVLNEVVQAELNDGLIREFIEELEKANFTKVNSDVDSVELVSGRGIPAKYQDQISNVLTGKLSRKIRVSATEDSKLIGGIMMKVGSMVVDGSLAERIKESALKLKQDLAWKFNK